MVPSEVSRSGQGRLTLNLNVLGVPEDDAWCTIALEMSLRGTSETFGAATANDRAVQAAA